MKANGLLASAGALLVLTTLGVSAQLPTGAGDPLPGITPREFEEFRLGIDDFVEIEQPGEGLGPLFNGAGCAACHNVPVIGGITPMTEMRAGHRDADGKFHVVGFTTLFQMFSIPDHRCQAVMPPMRFTTFLTPFAWRTDAAIADRAPLWHCTTTDLSFGSPVMRSPR